MAVYNVANTALQTTAAGAAKTILQIEAAAQRGLQLPEFSIAGYSIDPAHGTGEVWVVRLTAPSGTGTATAGMVTRRQPWADAPLCTAKESFSVEGATGEIVAGPYPLSPVSSTFAWQFPPGEEPACGAGQVLALRVQFPGAAQQVRAAAAVLE